MRFAHAMRIVLRVLCGCVPRASCAPCVCVLKSDNSFARRGKAESFSRTCLLWFNCEHSILTMQAIRTTRSYLCRYFSFSQLLIFFQYVFFSVSSASSPLISFSFPFHISCLGRIQKFKCNKRYYSNASNSSKDSSSLWDNPALVLGRKRSEAQFLF